MSPTYTIRAIRTDESDRIIRTVADLGEACAIANSVPLGDDETVRIVDLSGRWVPIGGLRTSGASR